MSALLRAQYGKGTSTAITNVGRKKIHTTWSDRGVEMVEEYDVNTDELLVRKLRSKNNLGAWDAWKFEIGEPIKNFNPSSDLIAESSLNPIFSRQDTISHFVFRIRNLPHPKEVYQIEIDVPTQEIVVRTTNKKYYKRIQIPDLKAAGPAGVLDSKHLQWQYANNTLIIGYTKPPIIVEMETKARAERQQITSSNKEEGDMDCKQQ